MDCGPWQGSTRLQSGGSSQRTLDASLTQGRSRRSAQTLRWEPGREGTAPGAGQTRDVPASAPRPTLTSVASVLLGVAKGQVLPPRGDLQRPVWKRLAPPARCRPEGAHALGEKSGTRTPLTRDRMTVAPSGASTKRFISPTGAGRLCCPGPRESRVCPASRRPHCSARSPPGSTSDPTFPRRPARCGRPSCTRGCPPDTHPALPCLKNTISAFVRASQEAVLGRLISLYLDVSAASSIIKP